MVSTERKRGREESNVEDFFLVYSSEHEMMLIVYKDVFVRG